ncbi:MAG TPA: twin-arginine translocase TatA/TatE family subunit [Bryobacteraceae bacterium]|nr:twin-arginine translocase TatA/TatE family subunit [Bryobacteraceae bacterium]
MGPVGVQEMIVIFLVALVLFGPKKLPELGKTIAKAVSEFRRAQSDLKATFEKEMKSLEAENEALKEATRQTAIDLSAYSNIDLTGGTSGTYGADTHPADAATDWHGVESGAPTTVGASEVPGAESHGALQSSDTQTSVAEAAPPAVHAAGETVARGEVLTSETPAPAAVAVEEPAAAYTLHEAPLHETQNS